MPNPKPSPPDSTAAWTLEVVRGAHLGQRYALAASAVVLGNGDGNGAGNGAAFVNLAAQEATSPRKMAGQHAALNRDGGGGWAVRDLDSPSGTFVNNRRVLAGAALPLAAGDVIQLGAVQVRVVAARAASPPPPSPLSSPPPMAAPGTAGPTRFAYESSASGTTCRTWDDFLTFSAQKWDELRDDLIAGRLAAFTQAVGRPDLAPPAVRGSLTTEQADEHLDRWLALLPTRTPAAPELDVHPPRINIAVAAGGVTVTRKVRVANVGHGLLRVRVHLEGATGATFTLGSNQATGDLVIRDDRDVAFEVAVPDPFVGPATAQLVVRGAGTEQRVSIQVDRKSPSASADPGDAGDRPEPAALAIPGPLAAFLALPIGQRVVIAALICLATRLLVGVAGGAIGEDAMRAAGPDVPHLGGVVLAFGATGAALGGWLVARRAGWGDALAGSVAGAGLGALLAAASVACCRATEPLLGPLAASPIVVCALWGLIGGALALVTPGSRPTTTEPSR